MTVFMSRLHQAEKLFLSEPTFLSLIKEMQKASEITAALAPSLTP